MRWPSFCGPTFLKSQSLLASPERCMNLYPQRVTTARGPEYVLYPTPGLETFVTPDAVGGRALSSWNGQCWAAVGTRIYEIFEGATTTNRGTVATDQYPATMV